jgi:hypothetical protein
MMFCVGGSYGRSETDRLVGSVLASTSYAQYPAIESPQQFRLDFEDDQVRVLRVLLGPREGTPVHEHPDGVLVYLTADLEGHVPAAEAT